jgi:hypothetical protein
MKTWCLFFFLIAINQSFCQENDNVQENTENEVEEPKGKPYFNVNLNPYILNTSFDLIGVEARIDHLFYNADLVDFGYGISGRVGADFNSDEKFSCSVYLLTLYGPKTSKFEISSGLNIPYYSIRTLYAENYEFVHFGIGYRYVGNNFPFTIRIGIATTGFVNFGFGFKFSYGKK